MSDAVGISNKKLLLLEQYSDIGGAEIVAYNFLKAIKDEVNITAVIPKKGELSDLFSEFNPELIEYQIPSFSFKNEKYVRGFLNGIIEKNEIEIIYTPMIRCGIYASYTSTEKNIPLVFHLNEIIPFKQKIFLRQILKKRSVIPIAVSECVKSSYGIKKIRVLNNALFNKVEFNPKKENTFGYIGRMVPQKGVHLLIPIFQKIREHIPEAKFFLVGDEKNTGELNLKKLEKAKKESCLKGSYGSYKELIDHLIAINGLKDSVFKISNEKHINEIYEKINVLFAPSWKEPAEAFGLTVLEGMASGCMVFASDSGNFKYLIDDKKNGFIVDFYKTEDIIHKIKKILSDKEGSDMIRKNAIETSDEYSLEKFNKSVLEVFKNAKG